MMGAFGVRRLGLIAASAASWVALWGDISAANILAGLAVGFAVTVPWVAGPLRGPVRLVALAQLLMLVAVDLFKSTLNVAGDILKAMVTRTVTVDERAVDMYLEPELRGHMLFLTAAVTLTPGTAVIDADVASGRLRLHLLQAAQAEETIEHVKRLAELAEEALPRVEELAQEATA